MTGADQVTFVAGVLIAGSYLAGAIVRTWTRRTIDSLAAGADNDDRTPTMQLPLTEGAVVLLCAGLSLIVIDAVAPGSNAFRNASGVGFLSSKVLPVWEAVSLWAGLAAVIGTISPVFTRFAKESTGLPGAVGLLALHDPIVLLLAVGTWATASQVLTSSRARLPLAVAVAAGSEWVLSMTDLRPLWGVIHGPESTLWIVALGGTLLARWSHESSRQ